MKITKLGFLGATSVAVLALTGIAAVAQEGPNEPDTGINIGYDEDNHLFIWDQWDFDFEGQLDCSLGEAGEPTQYGATYEEGDGGAIKVADLEDEDGSEVTFNPIDTDGEAQPTPVPYAASVNLPEGCGLAAAEVAGPNAQINHGQFMKLWNSMYEGTGRGCINRFLAKSDLGKGDQQIKVEDVDEAFEPDLERPGQADLYTLEATCERAKKGKGFTEAPTRGKGNPHNDEGTEDDSTSGKAKGGPKR